MLDGRRGSARNRNDSNGYPDRTVRKLSFVTVAHLRIGACRSAERHREQNRFDNGRLHFVLTPLILTAFRRTTVSLYKPVASSASKLLDPGPELDLPRPCASRLPQQIQIILCDSVRIEHAVGLVGRHRPALARRKTLLRPSLPANLGSHSLIFTDDEVVQLLKAAVEREGNQGAFARRHSLERTTLNQILNQRKGITSAVLKAIGLRKVYAPE